tara:strand:+ start:118 stop:285 length:168 start_codon:yes stop_codon:yes gene_type:complete
MAKKKKFDSDKMSDKEMAALKKHGAIILEKEKEIAVKHKKMWEEKKKNLKGFKAE